MPTIAAPRRIAHDEQLTLVEHLDELRTRLIVSVVAIAVAFGFCLWQNHALLHFVNAPLAHQTQKQVRAGSGPLGATYRVQRDVRDVTVQLQRIVGALDRPGSGTNARTRAVLHSAQAPLAAARRRLSAAPTGDRPVTLGIGEPFTATLMVSLVFALIIALPLVLYQLYGFLLPAFSPDQQRIARSSVLAIPGLFVAGVSFGYVIVLPAALHFFQNFNSDQFNVLVQAGQYYKFAAMTLLAMGLLFQIPVGILAVTQAGIVTSRQLRANRRYAILACVVVAAILPSDAITMVLEVVPLYLLFEGSLVLASLAERRARRRTAAAG
jgi:sec-independent protein translocase protein TatC